LDLEVVLASSCRRRIIKVLSVSGSTNVMQLVRQTNSTYNQVNIHLGILASEGIVFDRHSGRMRWICLNKDNPKTGLLLKALAILKQAEAKYKLHSSSNSSI
jgi:hypothetical protein